MSGAKRNFTPQEVRNAVIIAVIVTATLTLMLIDPSCRRNPDQEREDPPRFEVPR